MEFRWNEWNIEKCAMHNVVPEEAEYVVRRAAPPYPRRIDNDKVLVVGQAAAGDHLQVIYLIEANDTVFVIHARPCNEAENRRWRRSRR
jgi:uncharacterized DUF497 family protein